jgi:hypothetical protein
MPVINAFFIEKWILDFRPAGESRACRAPTSGPLAIRKDSFLVGPVQLHELQLHEADVFALRGSEHQLI